MRFPPVRYFCFDKTRLTYFCGDNKREGRWNDPQLFPFPRQFRFSCTGAAATIHEVIYMYEHSPVLVLLIHRNLPFVVYMTLDNTEYLAGGEDRIDSEVLNKLCPEWEGSIKDLNKHNQSAKRLGASKAKANNAKKTRHFKKGLSVKEALKVSDQKPNMSRRNPSNVLVAFPMFDKCDSLLYFPTTLIKHFNAADYKSANALMHKYVDKSCMFTFNCSGFPHISHTNYLRMMDIGGDLEPDRIMCVHSTKVIEDQINATVFMKVTDVQTLYNTVPHTCNALKDVNVAKMDLYQERAKRFQTYADDAASHNEQLKQQLLSYSYAEEDVLLYIRLDFVLTIDSQKGKIVKIDHVFQLTSVHEAV